MTKRQAEMFGFIELYLESNGYPPTIREIRNEFGLRSNRGVIDHLRALEKKGYIRRDPRSSRAIELLVHISEKSKNHAELESTRPYPLAGRIEAGRPTAPIEDIRDTVLIDKNLFNGDGDFLLEVTGDSMTGDHIIPGDLLVVKRMAVCESGDIIVAMLDGETTVKRIYRSKSRIVLEPSNPSHEPIVLAGEDMRTCTIMGKVIGVVRPRM